MNSWITAFAVAGKWVEDVSTYPRVHRHSRRRTGVDAARGAELRDGEQVDACLLRLLGEAGALLAEDEHAGRGDVVGLDGHGSLDIVDTNKWQSLLDRPRDECLDGFMVSHVLIALGHHGAATIPPAMPHDVHLGGKEGVGRAHH